MSETHEDGDHRPHLSNRVKGFIAFAGAIVLQLVSTLWLEDADSSLLIALRDLLHVEVLARVLLVIGVLYVVGTDLLKETFGKHLVSTSRTFLSEVKAGTEAIATKVDDGFEQVSQAVATGSSELRKETALAWVRGDHTDAVALKEVARTAYTRSYQSVGSAAYCEIVEQVLLDRCLAAGKAYRKGQVTNVSVTRSGAPPGLLAWEEITTYHLVPNLSGGKVEFPFAAISQFRVPEGQLESVLRKCHFSVKADGTEIVSVSLGNGISAEALRAPGGFVSPDGAMRVEAKGNYVKVEIKALIPLPKKEGTAIRIYEKSFISDDETGYTLSCPEPVHGFSIKVDVESTYLQIDSVVPGPRRYWRGDDAEKYADQAGWPEPGKRHFYNLTVDRWVLPGLVLALQWRPVAPAREEALARAG